MKDKVHLKVFYQEFALSMQSVKRSRVKREPARFSSYIRDRSTCAMRKQFEVMIRAGSLPLQVCKPSAGFVRLDLNSSRCFMCSEKDESFQHFAYECERYSEIRKKYGFLQSSKHDFICFHGSEKGFKKRYVDMWFEMWCFRLKEWRQKHPDEDVGCLSARRNTYFSR